MCKGKEGGEGRYGSPLNGEQGTGGKKRVRRGHNPEGNMNGKDGGKERKKDEY